MTSYRKELPSRHFWKNYIDRIFIPEITAYNQCLIQRLLPTFESMEDEARTIEQDRLNGSCPENVGPALVAENANDAAVSYMHTMTSIRQGLINMFAAGLYHLFEQQLLSFGRSEFQRHGEPMTEVKLLFTILKEYGIKLSKFTTWSRIKELGLLANVVKHAEGRSCKKLRELREDLFRSPYSLSLFRFSRKLPVNQPLAGQGIYLRVDDFNRYSEDVKAFWTEFGRKLSQSGDGQSQ